MSWQKSFLIVCLFGWLYPASAQLNIETGFDWQAMRNAALDQALSAHNERLDYHKSFSNLDNLFGFRLGVRQYLKNHVYTGLNWTMHMQSNKATNPAGQGSLTRRIYLQSNAVQAMLGLSGRSAGIGTGLSYDLLSTRHKWENENRSVRLDREGGFHQEVWLEWLPPGNTLVQLSIQPYARYYYSSRSTLRLQQWLEEGSADAAGPDQWGFGVRLVLINGPKPY